MKKLLVSLVAALSMLLMPALNKAVNKTYSSWKALCTSDGRIPTVSEMEGKNSKALIIEREGYNHGQCWLILYSNPNKPAIAELPSTKRGRTGSSYYSYDTQNWPYLTTWQATRIGTSDPELGKGSSSTEFTKWEDFTSSDDLITRSMLNSDQ